MGLGNKFAIKSLLGLVMGIIVGVGTWIMSKRGMNGADYTTLILHLAISGLIGFVGMGGSVVYDIESWPLLKATVLHYIACMISFSLASIVLSWFSDYLSFFITFIIMTVVYVCIWIAESWHWKKTIREINEELNSIDR